MHLFLRKLNKNQRMAKKKILLLTVSNSCCVVISVIIDFVFRLVELAGSRETTVSREASVSGETCTPRETSTSKRTPNQKRKRPRALDDVETAILSKFGAEDECDGEEHFGLHVASILRSLPPKQRAYTKIEIDKLLFSAQFSEPYIPPPIPYPPPTLYSPSTPQHPIHSLNLPTSNSTHRL